MAPLDQAGEAAFQDDPLSALTGANAPYIAEMFARYHENPQSVDANWQAFFATLSDSEAGLLGDFNGPSWRARDTRIVGTSTEADAPISAARDKTPPVPWPVLMLRRPSGPRRIPLVH